MEIGPRYMREFSCTGPACPDSCCAGWRIPVDRSTVERWHALGERELRQALASHTSVLAAAEAAKEAGDTVAHLEQRPNGACVLLADDGLCSVQNRHGHALLPSVCQAYPRKQVQIGARTAVYATLGCPEAARLALTDPSALDLLDAQGLVRPIEAQTEPSATTVHAARRQFEGLPVSERVHWALEAARIVAEMGIGSPASQVLAQSLAGFDRTSDGALSAHGLQQFIHAEQAWFEPFDRAHPHLMQNYLRNALGLGGRPAMDIAMAMALIRICLVGRAHLQRHTFGVDDYVAVVQAHSRYVVRKR